MPHNTPPRFRKTLLAIAAAAVLAPQGVWALDLVQAPPGKVEPYVRPNVIISIDDSGSMDWKVTNTNTGTDTIRAPKADGTWDTNAKRINILRYALQSIFDPTHPKYDNTLLPDKKIRLSWQSMWNNGNSPNALSVNSASMNENSMRILQGAHRTNFLNFVTKLKATNGTPSHLMFSQADAYMRRPLGTNSPLATDPGNIGAPYLACRRSYHIFMSDGRWNGSVSGGSQDDRTKNKTLPDSQLYGSTSAALRPGNQLYHDTYSNTLADWAFYSWATPLQTTGLTGAMQPAADYRKAPAIENFGKDSAGNDAILDRYWNPRYNPATWPHMVTYTIGFSTDATTWPGANAILAPTQQLPFGYDRSFLNLVTGQQTWPNMGNGENVRALDLWHAALNGRGQFYSVMQGQDLQQAFRSIFQQINSQTDPDLSSSATSGSNNTLNEVGRYLTNYEPTNSWKGFVTTEIFKTDGSIAPNPDWNGKNTADKLDALTNADINNRLVLSWSDKWDASYYKGGVPFKWASTETNLSTSQKIWLQKNTTGTDEGATKGQNRLNYIRGDRSLEGSDTTGYTTAKPFRERLSRQGDIINSDVWYTGAPSSNYALRGYADFTRNNKSRPAMLYVGGNDGMLHGFAAKDGAEKIAYVPKGVLPNLTLLTDPQYNEKHKSFVDGSPMTGDVDMGAGIQDPSEPGYSTTYAANWRTLLVGTLGAGGKGYFVLDVTNPKDTGSAPAFVEADAKQLVALDRTRGSGEPDPLCGSMSGSEKTACDLAVLEDKDIGNITARPVTDDNDSMRSTQFVRMNNNRWAVVLGNGYNSFNEKPVLLVQYLDGTRELVRIPATGDAKGTGRAKDNGLAAPRLVDLNGDGRADVAYAGDNLGNMWKFDLTSIDQDQWKVAFGGAPLFTATGPTAIGGSARTNIQPITVPPTVRANDRKKLLGSGPSAKLVQVGGMMVAFGTGRNLTKDDEADGKVQTLYSVLDNTRYREITTSKGKRLEVHPGGGTCPAGPDCAPAPAALGAGVTNAKLAQQTITEVDGGDYGTVDVTAALTKETWANFNGWYLDLPALGERLLKPMGFYDGSNILTVWSQVPAKGSKVDPNIESCDSTSVDGERQYRTFVNIMDGQRPSVQIVDYDGDGLFEPGTDPDTDKDISRKEVLKGPHSLIKKDGEINDIDAKNNKEKLAPMPELALRPSWRQVK